MDILTPLKYFFNIIHYIKATRSFPSTWVFSYKICQGAFIRPIKYIVIGENTFVGRNVTISTSESGKSKIFIGDNVLLAEGVKIIGGNHRYDDRTIPIRLQGEGKQGDIIIGNDVWIGMNTIVLSGVTIADGVILGAGSIVIKPIKESYSIYAGNPARFIKNRP